MSIEPHDSEVNRRQFGALLAGAIAVPVVLGNKPEHRGSRPGNGHGRKHRVAFYASTGPQLARYDVDPKALTLRRRESVRVPAAIQYAWPHP